MADLAASHALGQQLAGTVLAGASLLLLRGPLGAGKTSLVQGIAAGLGIEEVVTSPTFALAQHYRGFCAGRRTGLVHVDLYRLEQPAAALELFCQEEELALEEGALMAVEWPERLPSLPADAWQLELRIVDEGRVATLRPPRPAARSKQEHAAETTDVQCPVSDPG
ncbi:MAG: tRNA (adenosine(37)-N6)-threonylcarbamoyltransferase complex ATPase subunit type 1 TsaE [Aphanocapsa feldmannii 277cV]|uniref:tRNA threonylcarbamoyladenosine biosynthesis protein TsaE n=2 Tax=Aphanocapsa feldmannii TaxID=192050 RepID=A0A524RL38_9CHRO|nr:MAG: tRNA (adenosine(37)-N6)-threonylcarbamoyltransferase complex ATPase subunit type 1 TsaE [Aphanocapsa feldmannii 288cV]TGG90592.1 MAG: tRNA (adenosine(37)-N6)-threonylcarbamoyltransferase complex ATPase subunit type 1 TsaE [Aphanocapsa feldmannii 277cV]TGH20539.1 MAG: tRNA (adenosine(37)-N6)-threonylcarbamoyltransferase complex ATPase subunit type 1 TsaE [Aphanocapsa feldmannii 277cI]